DDGHPVARPAEERRRKWTHGLSDGGNADLDHVERQPPVDHQGDRPAPPPPPAKSCPAGPEPGTQKNRLPGTASCDLYPTSTTSTDRSPLTSCRCSDATRSASGRAGGRPGATKSSELIVHTSPRSATVIARGSRGAEAAAPPPARSPGARSHTRPPRGTAGPRRFRRTRSRAGPGWPRSRPWGGRRGGSRPTKRSS